MTCKFCNLMGKRDVSKLTNQRAPLFSMARTKVRVAYNLWWPDVLKSWGQSSNFKTCSPKIKFFRSSQIASSWKDSCIKIYFNFRNFCYFFLISGLYQIGFQKSCRYMPPDHYRQIQHWYVITSCPRQAHITNPPPTPCFLTSLITANESGF
jgi:hypothetical protein